MITRVCGSCKEEKPVTAFGVQSSRADKLQVNCKKCLSAYYVSRREKVNMELPAVSSEAVNLGELIRSAREFKCLTQEEVGAEVGVTGSQVRLWEKGRAIPRMRYIKLLVELLGFELPLGVTANSEGRLPLSVGTCQSCGKPFPVYKLGVKCCSMLCMAKVKEESQLGPKNPGWKGGRTKLVAGYSMVQVPEGTEGSYASKYMLEHRLVMSEHLGRPLEKNEIVHHRNGVRDDNRIENLELWVGKDPMGQRMKDLMEEFLEQPEVVGHPEVKLAFVRVFRLDRL